MQYSDDYLREYLPRENPPIQLVPGRVIAEMERRGERTRREDRGLIDRSRLWTYAMFSELALGQVRLRSVVGWWPRADGVVHAELTIGLYDAQAEKAGFGFCVNVLASDRAPFDIVGEIEFVRLGQSFPFATRATATELHTATNPSNATAACWAKTNSKGQWGIITAAHAVNGVAPGHGVAMDDGSTGILEPHFYQPIDAAMILSPKPFGPLSPLPIVNFPTTGDAVTITARSGSLSRSVISVGNPSGFYQTRSFALLFFLDNPGVGGDSGALIQLATGEACGIYCGAEPVPGTSGKTGRALNFAQAMFALDATAYL